jgi:transcriptional regulator with PAS, ATPase and Fis domain
VVLARSLSQKSSISQAPASTASFIAINCGAIPEGTIDSELFGHEKGSFTGAHEARKGYFEVTNGGTIFLDEIAEMPLATQARLLRVLEYGEFIKVGSSKVLKTDVRMVAASNVNLLEAVEKGEFRQDLYYRLNTVPIYVPALRERGADIDLLFRKFAVDFAEKYKVQPLHLTEDAKISLRKYRFPGNIRQLKNLVEQMSVLEIEREVNNETVLKYLPSESSYLPALYQNQPENERAGLSERDLLYKVLFEMRKDVNDLKKLVHGCSMKKPLKPPFLNLPRTTLQIWNLPSNPGSGQRFQQTSTSSTSTKTMTTTMIALKTLPMKQSAMSHFQSKPRRRN